MCMHTPSRFEAMDSSNKQMTIWISNISYEQTTMKDGRIQTRNSDLSLYLASSIFCWLVQFVTPCRHQKRSILCAISSANVVQKEVGKCEFRGFRPLTTKNLLQVHHCLLLLGWYQVPGTLPGYR